MDGYQRHQFGGLKTVAGSRIEYKADEFGRGPEERSRVIQPSSCSIAMAVWRASACMLRSSHLMQWSMASLDRFFVPILPLWNVEMEGREWMGREGS